jgi:hypothetical protein
MRTSTFTTPTSSLQAGVTCWLRPTICPTDSPVADTTGGTSSADFACASTGAALDTTSSIAAPVTTTPRSLFIPAPPWKLMMNDTLLRRQTPLRIHRRFQERHRIIGRETFEGHFWNAVRESRASASATLAD